MDSTYCKHVRRAYRGSPLTHYAVMVRDGQEVIMIACDTVNEVMSIIDNWSKTGEFPIPEARRK